MKQIVKRSIWTCVTCLDIRTEHTCSLSRGETASVDSALDLALVLVCSEEGVSRAVDDDFGARVA